MSRFFREPLLHFLIIGALVFAFYSTTEDQPDAPVENEIIVGDDLTRQLSEGFVSVWRRQPTEQELSRLIDEFIREEIFVREAVTLSLDRDDAVIRRRLRQKMEFLIDSSASALQPSEEELAAFFSQNQSNYASSPKIAFDQVFLGAEPGEAAVNRALAELETAADHNSLGERTLLPASIPLSAEQPVDGTFGRGFFQQISAFPQGKWQGPVRSGYGLHLVRVAERQETRVPEIDTVREALLRDWRRRKAAENAELMFARMRERYRIVRPGALSAGEDGH